MGMKEYKMRVNLTVKRLLDCPLDGHSLYVKLKWGSHALWGGQQVTCCLGSTVLICCSLDLFSKPEASRGSFSILGSWGTSSTIIDIVVFSSTHVHTRIVAGLYGEHAEHKPDNRLGREWKQEPVFIRVHWCASLCRPYFSS